MSLIAFYLFIKYVLQNEFEPVLMLKKFIVTFKLWLHHSGPVSTFLNMHYNKYKQKE
jgi:hypothetical protein